MLGLVYLEYIRWLSLFREDISQHFEGFNYDPLRYLKYSKLKLGFKRALSELFKVINCNTINFFVDLQFLILEFMSIFRVISSEVIFKAQLFGPLRKSQL